MSLSFSYVHNSCETVVYCSGLTYVMHSHCKSLSPVETASTHNSTWIATSLFANYRDSEHRHLQQLLFSYCTKLLVWWIVNAANRNLSSSYSVNFRSTYNNGFMWNAGQRSTELANIQHLGSIRPYTAIIARIPWIFCCYRWNPHVYSIITFSRIMHNNIITH
jgi:hypothetical protein